MRRLLLVFVAACGGSYSSSSTGGSPQALVVQAVGTQSSAIAAPGGTLQLAAYESVAGQYGTLTIDANGNYGYAVNNANGAVVALGNGQSLADTFSYTITDGNGDTATASLTVTVFGTDHHHADANHHDERHLPLSLQHPSGHDGHAGRRVGALADDLARAR